MGEDLTIALARIDERLKALAEAMHSRADATDRTIAAELVRADVAHGDLRESIDSAWEAIRQLEAWRQRVVGAGAALGAASGVVSGLVVAGVSRLL
jgi:hypothetical protein